MSATPSHQAGNSRRDQLTASLVVGGVLIALGAASGLGIAVSSGASPSSSRPTALAAPSSRATSSAPVPVNYIGTPGPGNLPIYPGGIVDPGVTVPSSTPVTPSSTPAAPSASPLPPSSPTPSSTVPTLNCPSDVVTGLLDLLLGDKGLDGSSGLLKTVLKLLPNLSSLLRNAGLQSTLSTDTSSLTAAQTNTMAQACTPVLFGLLGGSS